MILRSLNIFFPLLLMIFLVSNNLHSMLQISESEYLWIPMEAVNDTDMNLHDAFMRATTYTLEQPNLFNHNKPYVIRHHLISQTIKCFMEYHKSLTLQTLKNNMPLVLWELTLEEQQIFLNLLNICLQQEPPHKTLIEELVKAVSRSIKILGSFTTNKYMYFKKLIEQYKDKIKKKFFNYFKKKLFSDSKNDEDLISYLTSKLGNLSQLSDNPISVLETRVSISQTESFLNEEQKTVLKIKNGKVIANELPQDLQIQPEKIILHPDNTATLLEALRAQPDYRYKSSSTSKQKKERNHNQKKKTQKPKKSELALLLEWEVNN